MRIAQTLAGISLAEADVLRKAVGKKDAELIRLELGKFVEKATARGHDRRTIEEIAGQIETFGRYGFNLSHSVAYSVLSYQTAWLKTHYPADFMAALLSSCIGDTDSVVKYIAEARELGLEVLPPDVNESGYKFTVIGDRRIRFGLGAIRNVGRTALDSILGARSTGAFTSLADICARVDLRACNKRVFEALIGAGALDGLGAHRAQCAAGLDSAIQEAALVQEERASGQGSLFGALAGSSSGLSSGSSSGSSSGDSFGGVAAPFGTSAGHRAPAALPNVAPWSDAERLAREKEILGFYISGHPLGPVRTEIELFATHTVSQLGTWTDAPVALGVVITAIKRQVSKRSGAEFARLTVEDFTGAAEVLVFPEAWTLLGERLRPDVPMLLKGGYSKRDQGAEHPTCIVESASSFAELRATGDVSVALELHPGADVAPELMRDVRELLEAHAGSAPLELRWSDGNGTRARLRSRSYRIAVTNAALTDLRALLGPERVRLVRGS